MAQSEDSQKIGATPARQGRSGLPVLWVLLVSLGLAVIAVAAVWLSHSGELRSATRRTTPTPAQAAAVHAPPPARVTRQTDVPVRAPQGR